VRNRLFLLMRKKERKQGEGSQDNHRSRRETENLPKPTLRTVFALYDPANLQAIRNDVIAQFFSE
jgi:hypothetical protein